MSWKLSITTLGMFSRMGMARSQELRARGETLADWHKEIRKVVLKHFSLSHPPSENDNMFRTPPLK